MSAIDPIDGALLALVADDRVASKVLSVWVSMRLPASTTDAVIVRECSSMGISYADTAIKRLPIMLVLAARRRWAPGEVGAVVCTDSALRTKFGYASHAMVAAAGLTDRKLGKTSREEHRSMTWLALARWARTCSVKVTGFRRVDGHMGNGDMQYFAAVFRGQSPSDVCAVGR